MRNILLLNEGWKFVKSAASVEEATSLSGTEITLPHTWNNIDGQDGGNDYHRGTCWYVRTLEQSMLPQGENVYLEFNGAAMTAEVYVNGKKLCRHEGGYSTFRVDITDELQSINTLVVSVDNSENDYVYPQKADFTFYGGLYREVNLITVPKTHFTLDYMGSPGIKVTPTVKGLDADILVETWVTGQADTVEITIEKDTKKANIHNGYAAINFLIKNVHLWNGIYDPYLYTVTAKVKDDEISTRFGCRTVQMDPEKGFILNGKSYPLRGVSRHQDRRGVGNALTKEMHEEDLDIIKEMGANTIRLAHYQHAQYFYDLCDEHGMVVWAEIPYITMHMKNGVSNTLSQMEELLVQNYNHPSIVCWGLSNEITAVSGATDDILENHRKLNDLCHKLDNTRPTVLANVFMLEVDSPLLEIPDINSYNLYFGWYLGELEQNDTFFDEFHAKYPERVIGFSEYGADANPRFHTLAPERGDYSESYQTVYHEHMLRMIEKRPYLWATHVWNMFDFAADGRDEGGEHGVNQKGLVTMDRRLKKDAFYLYKAYWSKEPFVHICGSRYADRVEEMTEVKVYSNSDHITLYVDDKEFERKTGEKIFKFQVPIHREHVITARSNDCENTINIRKVSTQNKEYLFNKDGDIVNWFDKEELNKEYYSVTDTMGELMGNPEASRIVGGLMAQASASRGDVAESVKDNPNLQRMMSRMTLHSILKQAGDSITAEQIKELNTMLQKIKKS